MDLPLPSSPVPSGAGSLEQIYDLFDFGAAITIELPCADQIAARDEMLGQGQSP